MTATGRDIKIAIKLSTMEERENEANQIRMSQLDSHTHNLERGRGKRKGERYRDRTEN